MQRFDVGALAVALDEERQARGLTWQQLAAEINIPFRGTTSIPISVGTIRGVSQKRSVTSAVVLQVLRWLDRSPESFLSGRSQGKPGLDSDLGERLPDAGATGILRFDMRAIYAGDLCGRRRGTPEAETDVEAGSGGVAGVYAKHGGESFAGTFDRLPACDDAHSVAAAPGCGLRPCSQSVGRPSKRCVRKSDDVHGGELAAG
jgi:transcriptional regulator with XRE-family HTH domain